MGLEDAKKLFNRLLFSLGITIFATLLLSYFLSTKQMDKVYTGEFSLGQTTLFVSFIGVLFVIGIILLRATTAKETK